MKNLAYILRSNIRVVHLDDTTNWFWLFHGRTGLVQLAANNDNKPSLIMNNKSSLTSSNYKFLDKEAQKNIQNPGKIKRKKKIKIFTRQ